MPVAQRRGAPAGCRGTCARVPAGSTAGCAPGECSCHECIPNPGVLPWPCCELGCTGRRGVFARQGCASWLTSIGVCVSRSGAPPPKRPRPPITQPSGRDMLLQP
eukprot:363357-Chlamydomonas_euryale.AAC.6